MSRSKHEPVRIATLDDLRFAKERFRHEVELKEQAILLNLDRFRIIFAHSTRQSLARMGQRLMMVSAFNYVRRRFRKKRSESEYREYREKQGATSLR